MLAWSLLPHALAGGLGHSGVAVPLYAASAPCDDRRYPALAGPWVVACGPDGQVDRVLSLRTGRQLDLPLSSPSPALDDSALYIPGFGGGLIQLHESGALLADGIATIHDPAVAPAALSGERVVVLSADRVQSARLLDRARLKHDAQPVGWYPPAIAGDHVAWVDTGGQPDGTAIWWMPLEGGDPQQLAADGRHVQGSPQRLVWVTDAAIVSRDPVTAQVTTQPVRTGFSAPPSLWQDVLCWEEWGDADVDITCDDGLSVVRPGHQQWPSRWDRWLLFREGDQVWLLTAPDPS